MRRPSLRAAVEWIAHNDEPGDMDPASVAGFISVVLVADMFDIPADDVARRVVRYRAKHIQHEGYPCHA